MEKGKTLPDFRVTVGRFDGNRKRLAHNIFWWLIGSLSFTIVVDLILLILNWIRI